MHRSSLLVTMLLLAELTASAETPVALRELDPPGDKPGYAEWLAHQPARTRAAIAKHCAKGYTWDYLCNGIGPYGLEEPPKRANQDERARWEAGLTPEILAWVTKMCGGPKNLGSPLCGYDLPAPPNANQTYAAWRKALSRTERSIVDDHCNELHSTLDKYCDGIGPLHIPAPPQIAQVKMRGGSEEDVKVVQAEWDRWYRNLTKAQRAYYLYWCGPERGDINDLCGGTPLVVVTDGAPVAYQAAHEDARFAIDGVSALRTDWPTARTPWIARDLDGDGVIASGRELFGSGTLLPDGTRATDGFVALAALDDNRDGVIDAQDRAFAELLAWSDLDGDRRGEGRELVPLSSVVERISLRAEPGGRCDGRGNCERLRAQAVLSDHAIGAVVDVQLLVQPPSR